MRAGYVAQEEVAVYQSRGTQVRREPCLASMLLTLLPPAPAGLVPVAQLSGPCCSSNRMYQSAQALLKVCVHMLRLACLTSTRPCAVQHSSDAMPYVSCR